MERAEDRTLPTSRHLARLGLVAPLAFAVGILAAGLTWEGYSHRAQNISDLGGTEAPYAIVQNVNFIVFGLLVTAFAAGLRRSPIGRRSGVAPYLVGCFGIMMVVQGLTPCTPGCAEQGPIDVLHGLSALAGFVAFVAATLLIAGRMRAEPGWTGYAMFSACAGALALVFLVAWFTAGAGAPATQEGGTLQRVFVAAALVWLGVTGARLVSTADSVPVPPVVNPPATND